MDLNTRKFGDFYTTFPFIALWTVLLFSPLPLLASPVVFDFEGEILSSFATISPGNRVVGSYTFESETTGIPIPALPNTTVYGGSITDFYFSVDAFVDGELFRVGLSDFSSRDANFISIVNDKTSPVADLFDSYTAVVSGVLPVGFYSSPEPTDTSFEIFLTDNVAPFSGDSSTATLLSGPELPLIPPDLAATTIATFEFGYGNSGGGFLARLDSLTLREVSPIPVPAAVWLFGTGLLGLIGFSKRKKSS